MERQNRLLTVLATVLLVLVAIAVFGKQPDDDAPSDPDAPAERTLFADLKADAVQSLTLVNENGTLAFAKADGAWKMTAPKEMPVEERRVTEIVDRFASLKVQEDGLPGDLAGFGLDEASRVTVTIGKGDGTSVTAYVGRDAPVGYRSYVADNAGGPALLAGSKVGDLVRRGPDDFRSKEVWTVSTGTSKRIRLQEGDSTVVLRKDDHGWWLGDDGPRASDRAVEDWLGKASFLRAESFLDDADPATVGLAPPSATITVEDDAGTHTLELGTHADDGIVARSGGQIVRLGADGVELLKTDGWLSDALLPVRRAQVDTVEVTLGGKSARFTKADGAWKDAAGADTTAVDGLLDALTDATADRATPVATLGDTWGTITLAEGTTRKESVTLGQELPEGGRAAKDAAGGPLFRVPAETIQALTGALP